MSTIPLHLEQAFTREDGKVTHPWARWLRRITDLLGPLNGTVFTGTITTAKLTPGGSNGSMVFNKGVLVSITPAT